MGTFRIYFTFNHYFENCVKKSVFNSLLKIELSKSKLTYNKHNFGKEF